MSIELGQPIPHFTASSTEGTFDASQLGDKGLILFFYPKDNTPGCTGEAQDFTRLKEEFASLGYRIVGVSKDSLKSHANFIEKQALELELISDPDEIVCNLFNVIQMKKNYGREYLGLVRSTFAISKNGVLEQEWRNVRAKGHADRIYKQLSK